MDLQANVGRMVLGVRELMACEGIEVSYDFNPIKHHAADRAFPVYVAHGNSEMTITVDCAEFNASEEQAISTIAQDGVPLTVELLAGYRGGGVTPTTYTNCVVTEYNVTSRQGEVVKARVVLSKQSDS